MKYQTNIKNFNEFQFLNEEMTIDINKWLLRGVLPILIVYKLMQFGYAKHEAEAKIRNAIEHFVDASQIFKKEIDAARRAAIDKVGKFNDATMKDKINNLPIRIGTTVKEANASFGSTRDGVACIILNKDALSSLNSKQLQNTITHEFFHYVDFLIGNDGQEWSKVNEKTIELIINRSKLSKEDLFDRISLLMLKKHSNKIKDKGTYETLYYFVDEVYYNIEYYTSPDEVYARFQNLREFMFKKGYIDNINAYITKESLTKLLGDNKLLEEIDANKDIIPLLMIIKFNTDDLNKIAQIGNKNKGKYT